MNVFVTTVDGTAPVGHVVGHVGKFCSHSVTLLTRWEERFTAAADVTAFHPQQESLLKMGIQ